MKVDLAYGRGRLPIEVPPEPTTVLEPTYIQGCPISRRRSETPSGTRWPLPPSTRS